MEPNTNLLWEVDKSQVVVEGDGAVVGMGEEVSGSQLQVASHWDSESGSQ